jgi:short-subunit dehydrogenase
MSHAIVVGASSGIGAAIAAGLRSRGHVVSGLARRRCAEASESFTCDVTRDAELEDALDLAEDRHGPTRVLVYAAGAGVFGRTLDVPSDAARLAFEVGFWGLERATRAIVPGMRTRREGLVVAVLSIAARRAIPHEAHYAASKAAAARYLESLAYEGEPDGVRVRYLCPGFIDTGFFENGAWFGMDPPRVQGSGVTPSDVARAVLEESERRPRAGSGIGRVLGWRERAIVTGDRVLPGLYDALVRLRSR